MGEDEKETLFDRFKNLKIFKHWGRTVERKPTINMPKSQPCPRCGIFSKRINKTLRGANYKCRNDGTFFVVVN